MNNFSFNKNKVTVEVVCSFQNLQCSYYWYQGDLQFPNTVSINFCAKIVIIR